MVAIEYSPWSLLAALAGTAFLYVLYRNWQEARGRAARRAAFSTTARRCSTAASRR